MSVAVSRESHTLSHRGVIWHRLNGSGTSPNGCKVIDTFHIGHRLSTMDVQLTDELIAPMYLLRRKTMKDQTTTPLNRQADSVEASARKLYERLNPAVRDPEIPAEAPPLPIYDWEIASDTELELDSVRFALQVLDGRVVSLQTVNDEHIVVALQQVLVADVA